MSFPQTKSDIEELAERRPRNTPLDPLGILLQSPAYVAGHVFEAFYEPIPGYRQRLSASRYYWAVKPNAVAVDFERDAGPIAERDAKRAALAKLGVRYVVIRDAFDTKTAREQLRPARVVEPGKPPVVGKPRQPVRGRARTPR